jgi:hypothetical protein
MNWDSALGWTVVVACAAAIGNLLAEVLKKFAAEAMLERWKNDRFVNDLYLRFRTPLVDAASELLSRIGALLDPARDEPAYLDRAHLLSQPQKAQSNDAEDPSYLSYRLFSTLYRFCCLLAWIEWFRLEGVGIRIGASTKAGKLEVILEKIRSALADGHLNQAKGSLNWRDELIFREELRAIGQSMLCEHHGTRTVIGYLDFCKALRPDAKGDLADWLPRVLDFFDGIDCTKKGKDYRAERLKLLLTALVDLLDFLGAELPEPKNRKLAKQGPTP